MIGSFHALHSPLIFLQSEAENEVMKQILSLSLDRYGKVFKTNILGTPIIVSTDPDVNKVILQNHGNTFIPAYPKSIRELFGKNSILQINGNLHRRVHALIGGFLRSPQLKARITKDIEHAVQISLATWKVTQEIYVEDEVKKVPLLCLTALNYISQFSLSLSL